MVASSATGRRTHLISILIEGHDRISNHFKVIFFLLLLLQWIIFSFFIYLLDTINSSISKHILLFSQKLLIFQILGLMCLFKVIFIFDLLLWFHSNNFILNIHYPFSKRIQSWICCNTWMSLISSDCSICLEVCDYSFILVIKCIFPILLRCYSRVIITNLCTEVRLTHIDLASSQY